MKRSVAIAAFVLGTTWTAFFAPAAENGQSVLSATGTRGGLVVHLGCGDGRLTPGIAERAAFVLAFDPDDKVCALYIQRCEQLKSLPPAHWTRIWTLETK